MHPSPIGYPNCPTELPQSPKKLEDHPAPIKSDAARVTLQDKFD